MCDVDGDRRLGKLELLQKALGEGGEAPASPNEGKSRADQQKERLVRLAGTLAAL